MTKKIDTKTYSLMSYLVNQFAEELNLNAESMNQLKIVPFLDWMGERMRMMDDAENGDARVHMLFPNLAELSRDYPELEFSDFKEIAMMLFDPIRMAKWTSILAVWWPKLVLRDPGVKEFEVVALRLELAIAFKDVDGKQGTFVVPIQTGTDENPIPPNLDRGAIFALFASNLNILLNSMTQKSLNDLLRPASKGELLDLKLDSRHMRSIGF